jgi:hypothetical protein
MVKTQTAVKFSPRSYDNNTEEILMAGVPGIGKRSVGAAHMRRFGVYSGLNINAALGAGFKRLLDSPEIRFKNGIKCDFGNIPPINGYFRHPTDPFFKKHNAAAIIGSVVFEHLVGNSFKAGAKRFHVRTARGGNYAFIDVSDDGCGIPRSLVHRIFELRATFTTEHYRGHEGLGLYYSRVGIEMLGGTLQLVRNVHISEATDEDPSGVKFRITLPVNWPA